MHLIGAACLLRGDDVKPERDAPWAVDGFSGEFTASDLTAVQAYLDYVRAIPGVMLVEQRLELPGERGGTGDSVVLNTELRHLTVIDLKGGRGQQVEAEGNEQLAEYGLGALLKFDMAGPWDSITVAIAQPRTDHWPTHTYTREELLAHGRWMETAGTLALLHQGDPKFRVAGDKQCRWCPIRGTCETRALAAVAGFPTSEAEKAFLENAGVLTPAGIAAFLDRIDFIEACCEDFRAEGLRLLNEGTALPGWKLVVGRPGNRAWADKKVAEAALTILIGEAAYKPRELGSPTDLDKLMAKKFPGEWAAMQDSIVRAPGKPAMARDTDKRAAIPSSVQEFPTK
jgi:Protein of unknown function (DUF2800)